MRRAHILIAIVLTASFATSAWASCAGGADLSAGAQMACCRGGHDKCPMKHEDAQNCCRVSAGHTQQAAAFTVEKVHVAAARVLGSALLLPARARVIAADAGQTSLARALARAPSPPLHLLGTALLI